MNRFLGNRIALIGGLTLAAVASGCAAPAADPTRVVRMGEHDNAAYSGYPQPGTVWRLHEDELHALGPIVPPPDPPPRPAVEPEPEPAIVPSFGYFGSGLGFGIGIGSGWYDPFLWPGHGWYPYSHRAHPWRY